MKEKNTIIELIVRQKPKQKIDMCTKSFIDKVVDQVSIYF